MLTQVNHLVKQGLAIKKEDVPADVESWRLSVNVETGALTVFAEGKQEADALIDKKAADDAEYATGQEVSKAAEAASSDKPRE